MLGKPACVAGTAETRSGSGREGRGNEEVVITPVMEELIPLGSLMYFN